MNSFIRLFINVINCLLFYFQREIFANLFLQNLNPSLRKVHKLRIIKPQQILGVFILLNFLIELLCVAKTMIN